MVRKHPKHIADDGMNKLTLLAEQHFKTEFLQNKNIPDPLKNTQNQPMVGRI